jgi:DNA-binding transcriptional MerR regulator
MPAMKPYLSIQEAAASTGLSPDTLRYYERIGLIGAVPRGPGGQRRYVPEDMAWLAFLLRLRSTGMPVRQMQEFAELRRQGEATAGARRALLETHLDGLRQNIRQLEETAMVLADKIDHYRQLEASFSQPKAKGANHAKRSIGPRSGKTQGD